MSSPETVDVEFDPASFYLEPNVYLNLTEIKSKDFYWLLTNRKYSGKQTGAKRWEQTVPAMNDNSWKSAFNLIKTNCTEIKLRKFQFQFLHRIIG